MINYSSKLLESAKPFWDEMKKHPFITGVGSGTISRGIFDFWVTQDYIFVREALRFLGALEMRSPDYEISLVLADSFGALKNELHIFERYASDRKFSLRVETTQICKAYVDFLLSIAIQGSFEEAFAALWCAEKGYFDSWSVAKRLAKKDNPYQIFIDNWTTRSFRDYVLWIEKKLNALTNGKSDREMRSIERIFLQTARYECLFWDMAFMGKRNNL